MNPDRMPKTRSVWPTFGDKIARRKKIERGEAFSSQLILAANGILVIIRLLLRAVRHWYQRVIKFTQNKISCRITGTLATLLSLRAHSFMYYISMLTPMVIFKSYATLVLSSVNTSVHRLFCVYYFKFTTSECGVTMRSVASVCLSVCVCLCVCPVRALVCMFVFIIYGSSSYIKVIGSMSRSQKQQAVSVSCSWPTPLKSPSSRGLSALAELLVWIKFYFNRIKSATQFLFVKTSSVKVVV